MNNAMKKLQITILAVLLLAGCSTPEQRLVKRAGELCAYIPDHAFLERSREYMTPEFYAVLDTLFNHLPEHEAMDHEWLYYFVTGNGGTIADYEVQGVEQLDATHAVATILVRQKWEDGSPAEESDVEEHHMLMGRVNGQWLLSDFDDHKADCIRHIAINRKEQALRDAISAYMVSEIGSMYQQGEWCIPMLMIVAEEEEADSETLNVYGDFWVFWYTLSSDTLHTVSGGDHSGRMTVSYLDNQPAVTAFEQTEDGAGNEASAKRIFGKHYDIFHAMHSNADVREAVRQEQLREYTRRHNLHAHYYKDYGWPAVNYMAE